MSVYNLWDKDMKEPKLKTSLSSEWEYNSTTVTARSPSPPASRVGEAIFNNYLELIHSKSNISTDAKQTESLERPFDFYDDEEFAFGINLLNKNVACVGDNLTKLIQMENLAYTPHERMFRHSRRSPNGSSMPTWLTGTGQVLLRRCDRASKYQPLVEEVDLLETNADYSFVRLPDGRETTVSNRHLAPIGGQGELIRPDPEPIQQMPTIEQETVVQDTGESHSSSGRDISPVVTSETLRRSARTPRLPQYLRDYSI